METLAQELLDKLADAGQSIPVYLGSEWLVREQQLPHVVVVPGNFTYGPPDGSSRSALATGTSDVALYCKAVTFEEAVDLADLCYAAVGVGKPGQMRLHTEPWGSLNIRVAVLTITSPVTLARSDIQRIRVKSFTQHAVFQPRTLSTPEVPDGSIQGHTEFDESAP